MAFSKITLNNDTLMDVTQDTVASSNLLSGETATGADGETVEGAIEVKQTGPTVVPTFNTSTGNIHIEATTESGYYDSNKTTTGNYTPAAIGIPTQGSKTVTPSESAQSAVTAGKYTTGEVTVGAISSTYVGSGITQRNADDMTASGASVTAPAGYYAEASSKAIATATQATPSVEINSSTGLVTATSAQTAGYVSGGTKTGTLQLSAQGAKTVTPSESSQTAVAAGKYTTGAVTVGAVSSTYVGSGIAKRSATDITADGAVVSVPAGYYASNGSKSVATTTHPDPTVSINSSTGLVTASHTQWTGYVTGSTTTDTLQLSTQAAQTYHPSATDQTIASGSYLTGAQIVKAVTTTNLSAENIAEGVVVKIGDADDDDCVASITGTHQGGITPTGVKYIWTDADGEGAWDVSGYAMCSVDGAPVDDKKTRLWVNVNSELGMDVSVVVWVSSASSFCYIDWGDGSDQTKASGNAYSGITVSHTYSVEGHKVISIEYSDESVGSATTYSYCLGQSDSIPDTRLVFAELSRKRIATSNAPLRCCASLRKVAIMDGYTEFSANEFYGCTSLESVYNPNNILFSKSGIFYNCHRLSNITIPSGYSSIPAETFYNCYLLDNVVIPDTVTIIGADAFHNCTSLTSITLSKNTETLYGNCFRGCASLASIVFPSTVTTFSGNRAFADCTSLAEIHLEPATPPTVGTNTFQNIPATCVFYVPYSADHSILEAYKAATNWSIYASYMQEEPQ